MSDRTAPPAPVSGFNDDLPEDVRDLSEVQANEPIDIPTYQDLMKMGAVTLILPDNLHLIRPQVSPFLAGHLTCACLGFGRVALVGYRKDLANLLRCTAATAKRAAEALQAGGWLEFQPGPPGIGDSYCPGPALKKDWALMIREDYIKEALGYMRRFFNYERRRRPLGRNVRPV